MKRLSRWSLCGLAIALLAALAAVGLRCTLARWLLEAELRARGAAVVWSEVEHVGLTELRVRNLRLGTGEDLRVAEIDARYSPRGLAAARLDALSLRGVRLRASLGDAGISLGALDDVLRREGERAAAPVPALPASVVRIDDFELAFTAPRGEGILGLSGSARETAEGRVEVEARLRSDATLRPDVGALAEPLTLALTLDVRGDLGFAGSALDFELTAVDPEAALELSASGAHDLASGRGEARFALEPLQIGAAGLRPRALFPLVGRPFEVTGGSLQAAGAARWGGEPPPSGSLDVTLRDVSAASEQGRFEHLNAAVHVDGPWPASTPPGQRLTVGRVDFGLQLGDGRVSFQLRPDGGLVVSAAECSFAGGKVRTRGPFDLLAAHQELVLELSDIDLAALLALVDLDGLTGSGRLAGRIPLVRRGGTLEIRKGRLSATGPGWVRYASRAGSVGAAGRAAGLDVALAVLRNFHFQTLVATLEGDTSGSIPIAIHLAGANPDYQAGQPVDFTLTVDSHLADLLRDARAAYRLPAEIERRVQRRFEKRR